MLTRPTVEEVLDWRRAVDERVQSFLASPRGQEPDAQAVAELGLQHEQQHQELLLTDFQHALSRNPLEFAYRPVRPPAGTGAAAPLVRAPRWPGAYRARGRRVLLRQRGTFARLLLGPFALAARPVTSGEYVAFIEDRGYERPELWLWEGFHAARAAGWQAPLYWEANDGGWTRFTLHGRIPVDPGEPVTHVSYYEADAFARWAGARLPTEAEWETAAGPVRWKVSSWRTGGSSPGPLARRHRSSAGPGRGRRVPTPAYPGYRPPTGRSASTTASSW